MSSEPKGGFDNLGHEDDPRLLLVHKNFPKGINKVLYIVITIIKSLQSCLQLSGYTTLNRW